MKLIAISVLFVVAVANPLGFESTGSRQEAVKDGKIVGGQSTTIDKIPYQVSLRSFGSHYCGGTIYSTHIIITAAHCFIEGPREGLGVVAGTSVSNDGDHGIPMKKYILHPDYGLQSRYDYDVAIILLEEGLYFGLTIQSIGLVAAGKETRTGSRVYVSGWGALAFWGPYPTQLQYVAVMTMDRTHCAQLHSPTVITNRMICAGEDFGGKDACQGDSGGPLVLENRLIGIVSFGEDCANARYPGVYTNVAILRSWMEETIVALQSEIQ